MNNHNARSNLQGTCKLTQACNSMVILAKTRQALSLPASQRKSSPLRNKPTTSGHRISSIVCPITSSKLPAENGMNNASWSISISKFQEKMNQTYKINARRPASTHESRSSIFEAQDQIINMQQQPQQQQQEESVAFHPSSGQELAATNRDHQSASSSFSQQNCKKSNRKINAVVLAMMNKKNNILKQFMSQQQNQPVNTQKANQINFVALSKLIKSNFVSNKDHHSCQNSSQIRPISSESKNNKSSQHQSQESLFRLKTTNSSSQLKETIQKQEDQIEKQFSSAVRPIYEFPQRKHRTFMSSERLSWNNSNSSSSTNLFQKSKYNNQSEIMSTTILSRNNSIAQNMISEQILKIQEISASMKMQPEEILQEQYKSPQRDAYNLLRERPYNFLQKTDYFLKQEEEIIQKAAISPQLQKVNFNRRAQSAQYQSRNRFHSSTSNIEKGQSSRFINLNNTNSYSSYSLKAHRDDGESEKSEQSSLKSWKRQTIIEGGASVENSIENAVLSDQILTKDPDPIVSNSLSKIKIIVQKSQGSSDIRSYSSRLEPSPQKTKRAGVYSHPYGIKKSLCGQSFTNNGL